MRWVATVLLDKTLFLKNRTTLAKNKTFIWPSSTLKTVDLDYRSLLLVAQLVRFWFKSLQSLTAHERQFLQGDLFLLTVCTYEVPLYLCSIFCSPSMVQLSTASYPVWNAASRGHVPSPFGILRSMRNGRGDDKSEGGWYQNEFGGKVKIWVVLWQLQSIIEFILLCTYLLLSTLFAYILIRQTLVCISTVNWA